MTQNRHPAWLPCRSYLFVPGDRPERFDKAWGSAADAVILDLEDAVSPPRKAEARGFVDEWLDTGRSVWVRCNACDTPWFAEDLRLAGRPGLAGFVLPKAEEIPAPLLAAVRDHGIGLMPLIETAQGIAKAESLAQHPEVVRLAFGALDLQVDLGIEGDDDALLFFRSRLVLASRLANKPAPVDGVTPSIDDPEALRSDTVRARRLGFGARLCIHPHQIATVHGILAPSAEARQWAARVVAAMAASADGAVTVDGKMVDRPVLLRAQAILASPDSDHGLRHLGRA